MTTRSTNSQSFDKIIEALNTLENASELNADELKNLIDQKFSKLKSAIGDVSASTEETFKQVDAHVKDNTWAYIGGAAAAGLVLGLLFGRRD